MTDVAKRPKPPAAGKGRPKGAVNKTTALLKDAILKAATDAGNGDMAEYLKRQAEANPGPFMALLGKVLPLQIQGEIKHSHEEALSELIAAGALDTAEAADELPDIRQGMSTH